MCKVLLVVTTVQIKIREYKSLFTARQDKTKKDSCTG